MPGRAGCGPRSFPMTSTITRITLLIQTPRNPEGERFTFVLIDTVAESIRKVIDKQGLGAGDWILKKASTGDELDPAKTLADSGLVEGEKLLLTKMGRGV